MNITVKSKQKQEAAAITFPVLMEWIEEGENKGSIVYFTKRKSGMTLKRKKPSFGGSDTQIEHDYFACDDESKWRKFDGVLELSNS